MCTKQIVQVVSYNFSHRQKVPNSKIFPETILFVFLGLFIRGMFLGEDFFMFK